MIMSGPPIITMTQKERDSASRRHFMSRRLRSLGMSSLSLGVAVAVLGYIGARLVA